MESVAKLSKENALGGGGGAAEKDAPAPAE